jgi:RNA polymerase sigma-70 factor (ECF subfamily)
MQPISDEQLLERVCARDHDAFTQLVDRHLHRAISLAQGILGVPAEADEVAQEVFFKLWERPALFDGGKAKLSTWLHRVVVNACIDARRSRRHEPLEAVMERPSETPAAIEWLGAEQSSRAVHSALASMPIRQRTALALFYLQGLPQREAASVMELSESAFDSLLTRARSALAATLAHLRERGSHDA